MSLLPDAELKKVFATMLLEIKGIALTYGFAWFVDAEVYSKPTGVAMSSVKDPAIRDGTAVYYHHPKLGHTKIDTFAKAMEIYGFKMRAGEDTKKLAQWWEVAKRMKDAPV